MLLEISDPARDRAKERLGLSGTPVEKAALSAAKKRKRVA